MAISFLHSLRNGKAARKCQKNVFSGWAMELLRSLAFSLDKQLRKGMIKMSQAFHYSLNVCFSATGTS